MLEFTAIICVDHPEEVAEFYGWLRRNRRHIVGISDNTGCRCCVDIFAILLYYGAEPMPSRAGGEFERDTLEFGSARDRILDELLELPA